MSVVLVARRNTPGLFAWLVRRWTKSRYDHCELLVGGRYLSSAFRDGGVRSVDEVDGEWDVLPLPWADEAAVAGYFAATDGQPYDWPALIGSQIFNRRDDVPSAAFCSEWCAAALGLPVPQTYSPESLWRLCQWINEVTHDTAANY